VGGEREKTMKGKYIVITLCTIVFLLIMVIIMPEFEETLPMLIAITIFIVVILTIMLLPFIFLGHIIYEFLPISVRLRLSKKIRRIDGYLLVILKKNAYFQKLDYDEKKRFRQRVLYFIYAKKFHRYGDFDMTDEMMIQIAAAATQITFGCKYNYDYAAFRNVVISEKEYFSRATKKMHEGEVNPPKEMIAFSWESFKKGISDPHDSINVGFHEFAHALFVNNVRGKVNNPFKETIGVWHTTVSKIAQEQVAHDFFRRYAFVNKMEFFAVSMEYFFENPKDFNIYLPELYRVMSELLNQNPLLPNNGIERTEKLNDEPSTKNCFITSLYIFLVLAVFIIVLINQ
jgi:Mlc titration factor MtfA (ptsG expression regulator)